MSKTPSNLFKNKMKRKNVHDSSESAKDNSHLLIKLDARKRYIEKYLHGEKLSVLETCAGEHGYIWTELKKSYILDKYIGFDKKPVGRGIIQGEAETLLTNMDVSEYNVIDIDTYGLPWNILKLVTEKFNGRAVMFLTLGNAIDIRPLNQFERSCLGIPEHWNIPTNNKLFMKTAEYCLYGCLNGCTVTDVELTWCESIVGHGVVGYLSMLLEGKQ